MVREENVGYGDQMLRLVVSILLLLVFFADLLPGNYNLGVLLISAALMYTAVTRSCEPYTLIGFKTSDKTKPIPLEKAVEYLVGVAAFYMVVLLLKFYLL